MQSHTKTVKTTEEAEQNGASPARKPSEQALEVVDVTFGAMPRVAEVVRETIEKLRDPSTRTQELEALQRRVNTLRDPQTRDGELESLRKSLTAEIERAKVEGPRLRRKATDQFVDQTKKARKRVEPVYKDRVEPLYKEHVEPVYKQRVEPTVKKVRERV
jgi:cation transport regulator ChaC